jgi:hypothetical protein
MGLGEARPVCNMILNTSRKKIAIKALTLNANMDKFVKKKFWFCYTNLVGMHAT